MKHLSYLVALLIGLSSTGFADPSTLQSQEQMLSRAQSSYLSGDYVAAVDQYRQIWDSGVQVPGILFNLANAYFRAEHAGASIAALIAAKQMRPRDSDIHSNLLFALKSSGQEVAEQDIQVALQSDSWLILRSFFSRREILLMMAVLWAIALICAARMFLLPQSPKRSTFKVMIGMALAAFVLLGTQLFDAKNGSVCDASTDVFAEPSEASPKIVSLKEGTLVSFDEYKKSWLRIRTLKGENGFVEGRKICFFAASF